MNIVKSKVAWLSVILIGSLVFFFNYGTPWNLYQYNKGFENYLEEKYQGDFVINEISYDVIHDTYHAKAYEKSQPDIRFSVGQDSRNKETSDAYEYEVLSVKAEEEITAMVKEHLPEYQEVNVEVVSEETKELEVNIWINDDPGADLKKTIAKEIERSEYTTNQLFFNTSSN